MPGFVCSNGTNTKYPVNVTKDGGYECPTGYYCPLGSAIGTPCPVGTYNMATRGESLSDCSQCPNSTFNNNTGSTTCTICGRSAISTANYTSCECTGKFRIWRPSDNQCVCLTGYSDPNMTESSQTSVQSLDCNPILTIVCSTGEHLDNTGVCISDSICQNSTLCGGLGATLGYYSTTSLKCMCKDTSSDISSYCDSTCQANALKAYYNQNGSICLEAGTLMQCYNQSVFGTTLNLDGVSCA